MKSVTYYALAMIALAGCSEDAYFGQEAQSPANRPTDQVSILFGAGSNQMTRSTSGLETVTGTFKVYGTKGNSDSQVFNNYAVWHAQLAGQTLTDSYYWDYVGASGSSQTPYMGDESGTLTAQTPIVLDRNQTEKFWDYEQDYYRFWAIAPWDANVKFYTDNGSGESESANNTDGIVTKAVISNVGGHLNANTGSASSYKEYYIANPLKIEKADFDNKVNFTFGRIQSKVRVGIYEIVPGYEITDIKFYQTRISKTGKILKVDNGSTVTGRSNIILNRTDKAFVGNATAGTAGTATVTYDNTNLTYSLSYDALAITSQKYFEAGKMSGVPATGSTDAALWGTDGDMDPTSHYFSVLPTPTENGNYGAPYADNSKPIYICCDFTLKSNDGNSIEEIHVKGATAVIPATYTTWKPNHAYTYLFKISRNTNGTTGNWDPTGPVSPEDPSNPDPDVPNTDPSDPANINPSDPTPGPTDPTDPSYDPAKDPTLSPDGLFAITFDAVVEDIVDGAQEGTTTIFATPSITTYQNGNEVTDAGIVYKAGEDITFAVMENTTDVTSSYKVYVSANLPTYSFDKTPEQNGAAFTLNTTGKIVNPVAGWYVIKAQDAAVSPTHVAYKVIRVGVAE